MKTGSKQIFETAFAFYFFPLKICYFSNSILFTHVTHADVTI